MDLQSITETIFQQGYISIDSFLSHADFLQLSAITRDYHQQGRFKQARVGRLDDLQTAQNIRRDSILWVDEEPATPAVNAYLGAIQALAAHINQTAFLGLTNFETHFAIYKPGDFYRLHVDQFRGSTIRQISCVYYLNEHWENHYGGELKLYSPEKTLLASIFPEGNRFVCFQSHLPHEVCETRQYRFSIAGWLKRNG